MSPGVPAIGTEADVAATVASLESGASLDTVFAPVQSQTAFEETVERLGGVAVAGLAPTERGSLAAAGASLPLHDWL